jgi:hypothetical protein
MMDNTASRRSESRTLSDASASALQLAANPLFSLGSTVIAPVPDSNLAAAPLRADSMAAAPYPATSSASEVMPASIGDERIQQARQWDCAGAALVPAHACDGSAERSLDALPSLPEFSVRELSSPQAQDHAQSSPVHASEYSEAAHHGFFATPNPLFSRSKSGGSRASAHSASQAPFGATWLQPNVLFSQAGTASIAEDSHQTASSSCQLDDGADAVDVTSSKRQPSTPVGSLLQTQASTSAASVPTAWPALSPELSLMLRPARTFRAAAPVDANAADDEADAASHRDLLQGLLLSDSSADNTPRSLVMAEVQRIEARTTPEATAEPPLAQPVHSSEEPASTQASNSASLQLRFTADYSNGLRSVPSGSALFSPQCSMRSLAYRSEAAESPVGVVDKQSAGAQAPDQGSSTLTGGASQLQRATFSCKPPSSNLALHDWQSDAQQMQPRRTQLGAAAAVIDANDATMTVGPGMKFCKHVSH